MLRLWVQRERNLIVTVSLIPWHFSWTSTRAGKMRITAAEYAGRDFDSQDVRQPSTITTWAMICELITRSRTKISLRAHIIASYINISNKHRGFSIHRKILIVKYYVEIYLSNLNLTWFRLTLKGPVGIEIVLKIESKMDLTCFMLCFVALRYNRRSFASNTSEWNFSHMWWWLQEDIMS